MNINISDIRKRLSENTAIDAKEIQALCDEVESNKWISVDDGLPERRQPVLILCSYGKMATAICTDESKPDYGWTDWMRAQHSYGSVTHWKPLPKTPTELAIQKVLE